MRAKQHLQSKTILNQVLRSIAVALVALTMITAFTGCAWLNRSESQRIIKGYEVGWADMVQNRSIDKLGGETLVYGYVYAVGHNERFIIAKQHLTNDTTTYYYIIDIKTNEKRGGRDSVYRSLDKHAFDSLRNKLKISNIPFDMNYPERP